MTFNEKQWQHLSNSYRRCAIKTCKSCQTCKAKTVLTVVTLVNIDRHDCIECIARIDHIDCINCIDCIYCTCWIFWKAWLTTHYWQPESLNFIHAKFWPRMAGGEGVKGQKAGGEAWGLLMACCCSTSSSSTWSSSFTCPLHLPAASSGARCVIRLTWLLQLTNDRMIKPWSQIGHKESELISWHGFEDECPHTIYGEKPFENLWVLSLSCSSKCRIIFPNNNRACLKGCSSENYSILGSF